MLKMAATSTKTKSRRKKGPLITRGKRKRAIARASIRLGKGIITINGVYLSAMSNPLVREIIAEPLTFTDGAKYDIDVVAEGGGTMGQAQAIRTAIARALVEQEGEGLKATMLGFDKSLIVEDPRRVEPKKFKGPKARARFTKSYR